MRPQTDLTLYNFRFLRVQFDSHLCHLRTVLVFITFVQLCPNWLYRQTLNGDAIRQLRQKMIGTPTIKEIQVYYTEEWETLNFGVWTAVEHHPSKASSTYYLKCYLQYFASVFASFQEIDRVLKKSGQARASRSGLRL